MTTTYSDLQGKNVLVTGGASGLGYAIAGAFAAQGSNVLIVGRNEERLKAAKRQLGEKVTYIPFDLNNIDRLAELAALAIDAAGEIDVLVNNAGVHQKKDALAVTNQEKHGCATNREHHYVELDGFPIWHPEGDGVYCGKGGCRRHDAGSGGGVVSVRRAHQLHCARLYPDGDVVTSTR
jgi:hypothetical protein